MEINKPLRNWEMTCLAERMSPMEFDQIAVRYLEIIQIRLDQIREEAGGNCITYMANSLIMWKDTLVQNKARQILYSKLTKAADNGLIARTSFKFLVTGEEDDEYEHFHGKGQSIWAKLNLKLRSCSGLVAVLFFLLPALIAGFLFVEFPRAENIKLDSISTTFLNVQSFYGSPTYHFTMLSIDKMMPLMFAILVTFCLIVGPWLCIFCVVCFQNSFDKCPKPEKHTIRKCSIVMNLHNLILGGLLLTYYFYMYTNLRYFEVPEEALSDNMYLTIEPEVYNNSTVKRSWNKLQLAYDCCGIHNYSDWTQIFQDEVPSSCCKNMDPSCGKLSKGLETIHQAGCAPYLASHISDQVKLQSIYFLIYLLLAGFTTFFMVVASLADLYLVIKRNQYRPLSVDLISEV